MSPKKPQKLRIAANGYRLCDPLPKGEVLTDNTKNKWILGSPIGCGGFGDIYSCKSRGDRTDDYVIKLDNINGPLFQEMNFYMRAAKEDQIKKFMATHRLKFLGMPKYIATGIHDKSSADSHKRNNATKPPAKKNSPTLQYRFLVMERFGDQLEDWVKAKQLTTSKAADVAIKMIDVLQYIHSFGYIHADIKGTNILKSLLKSKTANDWYLVDFGLAERYCDQNGRHKEDKPDKKRANNGTVEYRSRDAHVGQLSRRSDIECLAYNLIQWLYGTLPWMSCLKDAKKVEKLKEDFFDNLDQSLRKCFQKSVPNGLKEFLKLVDDIDFDSEPNYNRLKDVLLKKVSKHRSSSVNDGDDEEEEEVGRRATRSSSESTVDTLKANSPLKRQMAAKNVKITAKDKPKNNKRKQKVDYIEISDSENTSVESVMASPPKRTRNTPQNARHGLNLPPLIGSGITSPNRRSARKPVPRFSTPLLFAASDEEEDSSKEEDSTQNVCEVPVLDLNSSGDSKVDSDSGKDEFPNETPAMREIRERMEKNRREKELKKKRKK